MGKQSRQIQPILLTDESTESSQAVVELTRANVRFVPVPGEGPGPVLLSQTVTFRGLEGVERFIDERRTPQKQTSRHQFSR